MMVILGNSFYDERNKNLLKYKLEKFDEVLCACILDAIKIVPNNLIIDDKQGYPDCYLKDNSIGFEIVHIELDCDLDFHKMGPLMEEHNYNYDEVVAVTQQDNVLKQYQFCNNIDNSAFEQFLAHISKKAFCFELDKNRKITSFSSCHGLRNKNELEEIYKKNVNTKLKKLNNGNYKNCDKKFLVTTCWERLKTDADASWFYDIYTSIVSLYEKTFDGIIYIASDKVYMWENKREKNISYNWGDCISKAHKLLGIIN